MADPGSTHTAVATTAGHDKHAGHSIEMFRNRFWISLLLTIPTLVLGHGCNPYPKQRRVG